jgi:hypothetical protein
MGLLEPHGRGRGAFRGAQLRDGAPVVVVHALAHAVAALTAAARCGRPVALMSAVDAGIGGGPGWWRELVAAARRAAPAARATAALDCGDDAGAAQAALRAGVEVVIFTGCAQTARRLADIARQRGATLVTERPPAALDLGDDFLAA